jgi:hypothetical protein
VTADRRLRIGGWAALVLAIAAPLRIAALWTASTAADPWTSQPYLAVEAVRVVAALVAVIGLDGLFRDRDAVAARRVLAVGALGAGLSILVDGAILLGARLGGAQTLLVLAGDVLIAAWFIGACMILLGAGGVWVRIGWTAGLGGIGQILAAVAASVGFGGPMGVTGTSLIDWFLLSGLFVVVFLVRIWRYVVGGRLPGPGVL